MAYIGNDYIDSATGEVVHCQDTDALDMSAKVGVVDENGLVWEARWVQYDQLEPVKKNK